MVMSGVARVGPVMDASRTRENATSSLHNKTYPFCVNTLAFHVILLIYHRNRNRLCPRCATQLYEVYAGSARLECQA